MSGWGVNGSLVTLLPDTPLPPLPPPSAASNGGSSSGLSAGAVAGIVAGSCVGAALLAGGVVGLLLLRCVLAGVAVSNSTLPFHFSTFPFFLFMVSRSTFSLFHFFMVSRSTQDLVFETQGLFFYAPKLRLAPWCPPTFFFGNFFSVFPVTFSLAPSQIFLW